MESISAGVLCEPHKRIGLFKFTLQILASRRAYINRATRVVLAEIRRCRELQYLIDGEALYDFAFNDFDLALHASEGRDDIEFNPIPRGGIL